jgi:hypothetical protein
MRKLQAWLVLGLLPVGTWGGRPLLTDDPGTVQPGHVELEAGALWVGNGPTRHLDALASLTLGVTPRLEAGAGFGAQWEQRRPENGAHESFTDCTDLTLGLKWQGVTDGPAGLSLALAPTLKLPFANRNKNGTGATDFDLSGLASLPLGERINLHFHAGYVWVGAGDEDLSDLLHLGLAVEYACTPEWQWVGELYAVKAVETGEPWMLYANAGLRRTVCTGLVLDGAVGFGLHGDMPDFTATLGLTWNYDWRGVKGK